MREQFRPYTMILGPFTDTTASSVTLRDTGGNALECNYISVEASAQTGNSMFTARIDVPNLTTPLANQTTAALSQGLDTSGFVGGTAKVSRGYPVEFVLYDGDRASEITIQCTDTNFVRAYFIVTYGQVWTGNPLRDGERPKGQ